MGTGAKTAEDWYGLSIQPAYAADDVLLVPKFSEVKGRQAANLDISPRYFARCRGRLRCAWIAPMGATTSVELALEAAEERMPAAFHRGIPIEARADKIREVMFRNPGAFVGAAIGPDEVLKTSVLIKADAGLVILDVADAGDCFDHKAYVDLLAQYANDGITLIVGNFANEEEIRPYLDFLVGNPRLAAAWRGRLFFKVGRSSGSICTTSEKTGVGIPLFTAVARIGCEVNRQQYRHLRIALIGDGGISGGAYAAKIIAAGANGGVMIGQIAAGINSSAAPDAGPDGYPGYKWYWGEGSKYARDLAYEAGMSIDDRYDKTGAAKLYEGERILVKNTGSCAETMKEFWAQIQAAMMATGCDSVERLSQHKCFTLLPTANSQREMKVHSRVEQPTKSAE